MKIEMRAETKWYIAFYIVYKNPNKPFILIEVYLNFHTNAIYRVKDMRNDFRHFKIYKLKKSLFL